MMNKKKICAGCKQEQYIWKAAGKDKYCKTCWYKLKAEKGEKIVKIKQVSAKKAKQDVVYSKLRKDYLSAHPFCQAKLPECTLTATDIHHKKGRGKYYLITTTWMSACRSCHEWIETHPAEAKELGFSETRI